MGRVVITGGRRVTRRHLLIVSALTAVLVLPPAGTFLAADKQQPPGDARGLYSYREASRDGIGKVYMGREISFVLGHRGTVWLEREEREVTEKPDLLVDIMELAPDEVVVDLGAGSGYFTFRISPRVPRGRVLAVDIQPEMLEFIEQRRQQENAINVETVLGEITDPGLEPSSVDAVLMVDAYHEFSHPREMMEAIVRALRPGGRVLLVEYRAEDPDVPMLPLHKMTQQQARKEMTAVGLEWVKTRDELPWQHFMVFRKPAVSKEP